MCVLHLTIVFYVERIERAEKSSPKRAAKIRKTAADKVRIAATSAVTAASAASAATAATAASAASASSDTAAPITATTGTTARASKATANRALSAYNHDSALKETADETGWTPAGMVALFNVQGKIDLHAPNFWELVSEAMADMGFEKTAQECQQKWFQVRDRREGWPFCTHSIGCALRQQYQVTIVRFVVR
jgi:hypothetical protein